MKVISNEDDMERLLKMNVKPNTYQYDLLLLLVDSENKGNYMNLIISLNIRFILKTKIHNGRHIDYNL